MNSTALFLTPGARANKLIGCANPSELRIFTRHHVVVADLRGRSDRVLRGLLTDKLDACDSRWRDVALLPKALGPDQTLAGSGSGGGGAP